MNRGAGRAMPYQINDQLQLINIVLVIVAIV